MGTPRTNGGSPHGSKGTRLMSEPTQDLIVSALRLVSALRCHVRVSLAALPQVLGLQCASILPHDMQRMTASGVVVSEEPLGLYAVLSRPQ